MQDRTLPAPDEWAEYCRNKPEIAAKWLRRWQAALIRLRDCDWTITPLDRMDAVRNIARAALNGEDTRPHD